LVVKANQKQFDDVATSTNPVLLLALCVALEGDSEKEHVEGGLVLAWTAEVSWKIQKSTSAIDPFARHRLSWFTAVVGLCILGSTRENTEPMRDVVIISNGLFGKLFPHNIPVVNRSFFREPPKNYCPAVRFKEILPR
jgi:hypothetical protein